jgi:hypothetical protein
LFLSLIAFSVLTTAQDRDRDKDDQKKSRRRGIPILSKWKAGSAATNPIRPTRSKYPTVPETR